MSSHRKDNLNELIQFVRENSLFYRKSLANLPPDVGSVEELPITDPDAYWKANNEQPNGIWTAPFIDGVVMRSGGTTGVPKINYLTKNELRATAQVMAVAITQGCGLIPGDRIANMSHHGSLYGSFMFFNTAIQEIPIPTVHLAIGGNDGVENMAQWMETFQATVLLCNVSTARRLAEHFSRQSKTIPGLRLILYTGEAFSKDLRPVYRAAFPNAVIYPSLYGAIDAGPVGIPAIPNRGGNDDINPVYKVLAPLLVVEIIDEDGKPIKENNRKGSIVITHLLRRQHPLLRYPLGDNASWDDYDNETFHLHGRDSVSLKISTTHLPLGFLRDAILKVLGEGVVSGSQFVARRVPGSDQQVIVFRIAAPKPADPAAVRDQLESKIAEASPTWVKNRAVGNIAPLQIEWISAHELVLRDGSGKLKDIIEERV